MILVVYASMGCCSLFVGVVAVVVIVVIG